MGVSSAALTLDILCSEGRHGPRVLCRDEEGELFFKARWTDKFERQAEQEHGRGGSRGKWRRNR